MQPQYDDHERQPKPFGDELHIYRARIVSKPDPGDDRLQVRIVPHMADIAETDLLPYYPPFFKGQVITGKREDIDQKAADYVWVAALPDFSVGFILGLANPYEDSGASMKYSQSYDYKAVAQGLMKRGLIPSYLDYKNLHVQYWTDSYLEMVDFRHGDKFIIQSNGNMIIMESNQIYLRVGSGSSDEASDNPNASIPPYSSIRMSRSEMTIATPRLVIRAGEIKMGDKQLNLLATASDIPFFVEGATVHPQTHITI
jgi:hypothetical protein